MEVRLNKRRNNRIRGCMFVRDHLLALIGTPTKPHCPLTWTSPGGHLPQTGGLELPTMHLSGDFGPACSLSGDNVGQAKKVVDLT